jgi:hypothetical protein
MGAFRGQDEGSWARAGGEFPEQVVPYTHIFYILEGKGEALNLFEEEKKT